MTGPALDAHGFCRACDEQPAYCSCPRPSPLPVADVPSRTGSGPGGVLVTLADVAPERVSWLWPGRIPAGKLVTLDGDPALGKSTLG